MDVQFTPNQQALVRQAIETERLRREEDALQEALSLWEERERARAELLASLDEAEASIERGQGRIITRESMCDLAEEVKHDLRERVAADKSAALVAHQVSKRAERDLKSIAYRRRKREYRDRRAAAASFFPGLTTRHLPGSGRGTRSHAASDSVRVRVRRWENCTTVYRALWPDSSRVATAASRRARD